jgi:hypothetical protein
MGQLGWRFRVWLNRVRGIPALARESFERGWDKELGRQARERPPLAQGLAIIAEGEALLQTGEAISLFGRALPVMAPSVDRRTLLQMFENLTIEWVHFDVPEHRALIQTGPRWRIRAQWMGSVWESRLIHTLLHFANMTVRLPTVDDEDKQLFLEHDELHRESDYWGLEITICSQLRDVTEG